jgi:protein gp37
MKARLLFNRRAPVTEQAFAELVLWEIRQPLPGCTHCYKYRLAFVVAGVCVLRYDNETGKGDHRHSGEVETGYDFVSPDRLVADFFEDVRRWRDEHSND